MTPPFFYSTFNACSHYLWPKRYMHQYVFSVHEEERDLFATWSRFVWFDIIDSVSRTLSTSYIVLLEYVLCNLSFLSFLEIIFFQQKIHFYNAREDCKKAQYLHDIFFNLYCLITWFNLLSGNMEQCAEECCQLYL